VDAIVAFGGLAEAAYQQWKATPTGQASTAAFAHLTHPTFPESASAAGQKTKTEAQKEMLENWNAKLAPLIGAVTPDTPRPFVPYGTTFAPGDLVEIPERDLPPGIPPWMRSLDAWASRRAINEAEEPAATAEAKRDAKRAGIGIKVPRRQRVWLAT
jgi:hypothetical protein